MLSTGMEIRWNRVVRSCSAHSHTVDQMFRPPLEQDEDADAGLCCKFGARTRQQLVSSDLLKSD
jgi:hypothetical protein